jgi:hypothetical protein
MKKGKKVRKKEGKKERRKEGRKKKKKENMVVFTHDGILLSHKNE